jgi:hypothetical protein
MPSDRPLRWRHAASWAAYSRLGPPGPQPASPSAAAGRRGVGSMPPFPPCPAAAASTRASREPASMHRPKGPGARSVKLGEARAYTHIPFPRWSPIQPCLRSNSERGVLQRWSTVHKRARRWREQRGARARDIAGCKGHDSKPSIAEPRPASRELPRLKSSASSKVEKSRTIRPGCNAWLAPCLSSRLHLWADARRDAAALAPPAPP